MWRCGRIYVEPRYLSLLVIFCTKLKNHLYSEWNTVTTYYPPKQDTWHSKSNDILFDTEWNTNKGMKWIENAIWSYLAYMVRTVQINWKDKTYTIVESPTRRLNKVSWSWSVIETQLFFTLCENVEETFLCLWSLGRYRLYKAHVDRTIHFQVI